MVRKIVTVLIVGGSVALAACNTVRGAAQDVNSAANCTENAIHADPLDAVTSSGHGLDADAGDYLKG